MVIGRSLLNQGLFGGIKSGWKNLFGQVNAYILKASFSSTSQQNSNSASRFGRIYVAITCTVMAMGSVLDAQGPHICKTVYMYAQMLVLPSSRCCTMISVTSGLSKCLTKHLMLSVCANPGEVISQQTTYTHHLSTWQEVLLGLAAGRISRCMCVLIQTVRGLCTHAYTPISMPRMRRTSVSDVSTLVSNGFEGVTDMCWCPTGGTLTLALTRCVCHASVATNNHVYCTACAWTYHHST